MKRHLTPDMSGQLCLVIPERRRSKPKPMDNSPFYDYIAARERVINDSLSKQWLNEHGYNQEDLRFNE